MVGLYTRQGHDHYLRRGKSITVTVFRCVRFRDQPVCIQLSEGLQDGITAMTPVGLLILEGFGLCGAYHQIQYRHIAMLR